MHSINLERRFKSMVYLPFLRLPLLGDCIIIVRVRFIVKSGSTLIPSILTVKYSVSSL